MKRLFAMFMALALTALVPLSAQASGGHDLNGAELSILWVVPFVCMLLSMALMQAQVRKADINVIPFWRENLN